jgi:hypothetical protein
MVETLRDVVADGALKDLAEDPGIEAFFLGRTFITGLLMGTMLGQRDVLAAKVVRQLLLEYFGWHEAPDYYEWVIAELSRVALEEATG